MGDRVLLNTDKKGLEFYGSDEKDLGLLHVITGDGKGKSTSSIGLCVRAKGANYKVLFVQFFKMNSSEISSLKKLKIDVEQFQFLGPFFKKYTDEEFKEMQQEFKNFWNKIGPIFKNYDLVVLDELVYVITEGVYPEKEFLRFLDRRPKEVEFVLTGRNFPESIKEKANYVSEVKKIKHPFDQGINARKGIEF